MSRIFQTPRLLRQHIVYSCLGSALWAFFALVPTASMAQQEKVFFGNLHSHSSLSDGRGTPTQAYTHARDVAKLDFLALTEHNHSEAVGSDGIGIGLNTSLYNGGSASLIAIANQMTQAGQFIALYGQEFSTISKGNHVNVFDIDTVIATSQAPNGAFDKLLSFLQTHKDSFNKSAILMLNHPKNTFQVEGREYGADDFGSANEWIKRMGAQARLIQMINGPGQVAGSDHRPAKPDEDAFKKFLNLGFKLAPTADQDNHEENWGSATPARTAIVTNELTKSGVLDALRRRHVYATEDRDLKIIIRVNNHLCGDIISPVPSANGLSVQYRIQDEAEPNAQYTIQVWQDAVGGGFAKMVRELSFTSDATGTATGTISGVNLLPASETGQMPQFVFFKVVQFDSTGGSEDDQGQDRAWTAPVWFQSSIEEIVPASDMAGRSGGAPGDATNDAVASRNSSIFHVSLQCRNARQINPANRVFGNAARTGRTLHVGCPVTH